MDKNKYKVLLRYIFLIALIIMTFTLVLKNLDISMLSSVITMVNEEYLIVGTGAIVFYIILEGIILQIIINAAQNNTQTVQSNESVNTQTNNTVANVLGVFLII